MTAESQPPNGPSDDEPPGRPVVQPSPPPPAHPVWTTFLTPLAVIIGAVIVAAAIVLSDGDGNGSPAVVPNSDAMSTQPTQQPGGAPTTMLAALRSYAEQVDIDAGEFEQCLADPNRGETISRHLQLGSSLGVTGTPTFFINNKMIVGAQPTSIFMEVIERELQDPPASVEDYSADIQALAATQPPRFQIVDAPVDVTDAPIEGSPDARVMIAEFSDFQCPFCQRWVQQSMEPIRDMLGDDVALAFMHFPITQIHPNAGYASFGAICAGEQGRFWEMHDLLFARQQEWANLPPN